MTKRRKMNLQDDDPAELAGTDLSAHPANFPLGSLQSRAAARALLAVGRFRGGDSGTFKCGCTFLVVAKTDERGHETGRNVQIIFPKSFAVIPVGDDPEHVHDFEVTR